jgi:hypothetical protein
VASVSTLSILFSFITVKLLLRGSEDI